MTQPGVPTMGGMAYSVEMRDIIRKIAVEVIDKERPRYRYARVQKIDRTARTCDVIFNGETGTVRVNMGSIQPNAVNQIVRVEGIGVDKYVTDVIGESFSNIRRGRIQPFYTSGKPYVTWDGETTLSGPYEIFSPYMPSQYDVVQGINIPGKGIVLYPVQDFLTNMPYARHHQLTLQNGWVNYGDGYSNAKFTKSASGIVKVQGLIKNGTNAPNEIVAQLPEGFRPSQKCIFASQHSDAAAGGQGAFDVHEDGTIRTRNGRQPFSSLDNIAFPSSDACKPADITRISTSPGWLNGWKDYITDYPNDAFFWPRPGFWKDADGVVWEMGLANKTATSPNDQTMFNLNAGGVRPDYIVSRYMHRRTTSGNNSGAWAYKQSGALGGTSYGLMTGLATGYFSHDGTPYIPDASTGFTWRDVAFQNSWTNYDTSFYYPAQYTKTKSGHVHLRGLIKGGAIGQIMFQLPAGYRPSQRLLIGSVSNAVAGRLDITAAGEVLAVDFGSGAWFSLDSINFLAEQ